MRLELAPLLRSLRPPRGPGGSFPSPSGMAEAPERSPRSAARGVQTRPRLQRRSRATASRASPPTHNLAALPSSGVRPEPAAGQLPLPREPAAGSRGPGRSEARGGRRQGPEAVGRGVGGYLRAEVRALDAQLDAGGTLQLGLAAAAVRLANPRLHRRHAACLPEEEEEEEWEGGKAEGGDRTSPGGARPVNPGAGRGGVGPAPTLRAPPPPRTRSQRPALPRSALHCCPAPRRARVVAPRPAARPAARPTSPCSPNLASPAAPRGVRGDPAAYFRCLDAFLRRA